VILFGVDGLDWSRLRAGVEAGILPNFARLLETGAWAEVPVRASVPGLGGAESGMNSPTLWTTIATGQYYFQHGVYDFCNLLDSTDDPPLAESRHVRSPRIWDVLSERGRASLVVGYYVTHPAYEINGLMVSDLFADTWDPAVVWPTSRRDELARVLGAENYADLLKSCGRDGKDAAQDAADDARYVESARAALARFTELSNERIDDMLGGRLEPRMSELIRYRLIQPFLRDQAMQRIFLDELRDSAYEFATVYLRLIDFVGHGFWTEGLNLPQAFVADYGPVVERAYQWIDERLGQVRERIDDSDRLLVVSDHGFAAGREVHGFDDASVVWDVSYGSHAEPAVLIASGGAARGRVEDVSLLDLAPSILDYFGIEQADALDGGPVPGLLHRDAPRRLPRRDTYEFNHTEQTARLSDADQHEIKARLKALGYLRQ